MILLAVISNLAIDEAALKHCLYPYARILYTAKLTPPIVTNDPWLCQNYPIKCENGKFAKQ